ncbi:MAG TPA: DUF6600 domain-containing protein [Acidobacteriota bacterium]|jgi:hypothetical protein
MRKCWLVSVLFSCLISYSVAGVSPLRLSALEGEAAVKHDTSDDWVPLEPNFPLTEGDRIVVQPGSRLELEVGMRSVVRLDSGADLLLESAQPLRLALYRGSAIIRTGGQEARLTTASSEIRLQANGRFRIDVNELSAQTTVFRGRAEINGRQFYSGSSVLVQGGNLMAPGATVLKADLFQLWSERRDSNYAFDRSAEYVPSNEIAGVSELDSYGTWSYSSVHGNVWYPYVNLGWSPYGAGHWYCSPNFGWTWISAEPWGWLPYHYGRWTLTSRGWCWVPGNASYFSTWSPALVYFLRSNHFIGWFPLGPGDRVSASLASSGRTWGNTPTCANWGVPGALMFLPAQRFARGEGPQPGVVAAGWNLGDGQITADVSDVRPQASLWTNNSSGAPAISRQQTGTLWGHSPSSGINGGGNSGLRRTGNQSFGPPAGGGAVIPQQGGSRIVIPQEGASRVVIPRRELPSSNDRPTWSSPPRSSGSGGQSGPLWGRSPSSGSGPWGSSRSSGPTTSDSSSRRRP